MSNIDSIEQTTKKNFTAASPPHILLAEDDKEMRTFLAQSLRTAGYRVSECPDGWNLLEHISSFILPDSRKHEKVDLMISDIRMPGLTGIEILEGIPQTNGFPPMILITAFGDEDTHARAEKSGAVAMFDKPFEIDDLLAEVHKIVTLSK
jgi:DNA-binding response OmpR family regulator